MIFYIYLNPHREQIFFQKNMIKIDQEKSKQNEFLIKNRIFLMINGNKDLKKGLVKRDFLQFSIFDKELTQESTDNVLLLLYRLF